MTATSEPTITLSLCNLINLLPPVRHFLFIIVPIRHGCSLQKVEESSTKLMDREVCLKDIAPAAENNINTQFIVLDKGRTILEGRNKTCLALVADETASVHFQLWGDECDAFVPGDIVRLANGIFSYSRNSNLVLRAGRRGAIEKVGEFTMVFVETPNMSEITWIQDTNRSNKYVQDFVISSHSRIFPPLP